MLRDIRISRNSVK